MANRMLITMHLLKEGRITTLVCYSAAPVVHKSSPSKLDAQIPTWKHTLTSKPANGHPSSVHSWYPIGYTEQPLPFEFIMQAHASEFGRPLSLYGKRHVDYNEFAEGRQNCSLCRLRCNSGNAKIQPLRLGYSSAGLEPHLDIQASK